jgi:hypothetical protein
MFCVYPFSGKYGNSKDGNKMNRQTETLDLYAKWSIADFDEESERVLRKALAGVGDFKANVECRKELFTASITRTNKEIELVVYQYMDEDWDLVNDALCDVAPDKSDQPEEFYEKIMEYLDEDMWFSSETEESESFTDPITYDKLIMSMDILAASTSETLENNYNTVKALVSHELGIEQ